MPKPDQSTIRGLAFLVGFAALCYALIMALRLAFQLLAAIGRSAEGPVFSTIIYLAQAGVSSFGLALLLALIFTLIEVKTTARKRLVTTYATSFLFLFLSFALFVAAIGLIEWLLAPLNIQPLWQVSGRNMPFVGVIIIALGYFFVADILLYWVHRLEHKNAFLWHLHAIHHAVEDLDSASSAFHPLSNTLRWLVTILPLKFLIEVDLNSVLILAAFLAGLHFVQHTRAPLNFGRLGLVFGDNRFHFVHHSKDPRYYNTNFAAVFPVIDMIFGTYQRPNAKKLPKTGLVDKKTPATLHAFLTGKLSD